ncbi:GAF and ANTAR domain-containing protein [Rhodococcus sp. SORGH_AS_0301]|uniref:GAF and ANTAR domain-containing protein n=1 Tax=Rhodococcus sp. SORGH_AS_0301 TaxID=3041780 RepID=UPI00277D8B4B|nr:GAF and ANTAR domain-containing protein [Rhodococcus sp. SORGH_AS_0301]MDQ1182017.1 transcriptional regulator with GAF, ATPase, and Fis domain [Rhodococcus sp. SORGH_AS_0301]
MTDSADTTAERRALALLAEALTDLDSALAVSHTADGALDTICARVVTAIPDADAAGVTVFRRGRPQTAASTETFVLEVDQAQYRSEQGPCIESALTHEVVRADLDDVSQRWPVFAKAIDRLDVASFLSAPVTLGGALIGALNLYSHTGHRFDSVDESAMRVFVQAAQSALTGAENSEHAARQVETYAAAMESRAAIEQAKGALMLGLNVSADKAFDLLLWRSQTTNIKVRTLAEQLVRDIGSLGDAPDALSTELGKLLMTAHTRVPSGQVTPAE